MAGPLAGRLAFWPISRHRRCTYCSHQWRAPGGAHRAGVGWGLLGISLGLPLRGLPSWGLRGKCPRLNGTVCETQSREPAQVMQENEEGEREKKRM